MSFTKLNLLFILILIDTVQSNKSNHIFNTVVTFGDANTDTGNVYRLTNNRWPLVPPYYQGRFSNNLIWIDRLNIPTLKNFAYGDATIDNDNLFIGYTEMNRTEVPGIRQQIVSYLAANEINTVDLSHTLYILWASGNEYLINSNVSSHVVVKAFLTAVYDLLVLGINQLVIFNIPPLQLYPGMMNDSRLYNLITEHNHCLLSNITQIQFEYPQTSIELFDVNSLLTTILSNQSLYHLNTTDKCWYISNKTIVSQCINPDAYVFLDDYHFTSTVHQIIANHFQPYLNSISSRLFSSLKFSIFTCTFLFITKIY